MSAIAGIFNLNERPVDLADVKQFMGKMRDFGQDRQGVWHAGPVALMHSMMRIAPGEPSDTQPLTRGHRTITGDVRLDNREELFRRLAIDPLESRGMSDSTLILEAHQKWGEACPAFLLGDFAFAIWDSKQQNLFCARDHLGSFPLYFHEGKTFFAFATVARHLLQLPGVSRQLNERRIVEYLLVLPSDQNSTYYQALSSLPAGHSISVSRTESRLSSFWSLEDVPEVCLGRDDEYVERLRELLESAVDCRTRTDHQVGSFLSGGLDSSSVAVTAANHLRLQNRRLFTYTSIPRRGYSGKSRPGKFENERPLVEDIVGLAGNLDANYVTMEGRSPLQDLEQDFAIAGPPLNLFNYSWQQAIGDLARLQGVRVMLSGDAGNFALSRAGNISLPVLPSQGPWAAMLNQASRLGKASRKAIIWQLQSHLLQGIVAASTAWLPEQWRSWGGGPVWSRLAAIHPEFAKYHNLEERLRIYELERSAGPCPRRRRIDLSNIALNLSNSYRDRASVWKFRHQISVSDPTRDKRIVEFCLGVPDQQYCRHGQTRLLLRRTMSGRLPDSVVWNRKLGRQGADWMYSFAAVRDEMADELERLWSSDAAARILDLDRMKGLFDRWPSLDQHSSHAERLYRHLFTRGLIAGKFICWHNQNAGQ